MKSYFRNKWKKIKLDENLKLSDLKSHAGISNFTKKFKNIRIKIKGAGSKSVKLVSLKVNTKKDYVVFQFLQEPTNSFQTKVVDYKRNMTFKSDNTYTQEIKILNFFSLVYKLPNFKSTKTLTTTDLKQVFKQADIQVWCNDPSFHWQGDNYIISLFNASIHPTNIAPKRWNKYHNDDNFVCKHLSILLASIDFWLSPMASMLNKYLKTTKKI